MSNVITAPEPLHNISGFSIFLGGSIEMGKAEDWQSEVIKEFNKIYPKSLSDRFTLLNPRRPDWDANWKQDIRNSQFYQQVSWELRAQELCDTVLMVFKGNTLSPISLLKLGTFKDKAIVVVEPEYFRKGNIDIFCERYSIPVFNDIKNALEYIKKNKISSI